MQNKPNFQNAGIDLTFYGHKDYEKMRVREPRKNKPKTNPSKIPASRESNPISKNPKSPQFQFPNQYKKSPFPKLGKGL